MKAEYATLTIQAAVTGWIVTEKGKPVQVFVRWEAAVNYLKSRLTSP